MSLFNRQYAVTIGLPGQEGYQYTDLRVTFDITKTSESTSNKAKIALVNLNKESISKFTKGYLIRLEAGYDDLIETVYLGDVVRATSERHGADVITTFECGDGEHQLVNAVFDRSYPPNTKYVDIITDLAKALDVDIGTVIGIQNKSLGSGFVCTGSVRRNLNQLLKNQKLEWSIQNGALQILPISSHVGEEAILISKETGLIGVPSEGTDFYKFNSLLNPKLIPGRIVQLTSSTLNGVLRIRKAQFEGDSSGQKWDVVVEAVKIPFKAIPPQNVGTDFITVEGTA